MNGRIHRAIARAVGLFEVEEISSFGGMRGRTSLVRRSLLWALAPALIGLASGPAWSKEKVDAPIDYGSPPDWEHAKAMAEAALRANMFDPDAAKFEWPNGFKASTWRQIFSPRTYGYVTCGRLNTKNRFGGYIGTTSFVVVIYNDTLRLIDADSSPDGGMVTAGCKLQGAFPPPPTDPLTVSPAAASNTLGLTLGVVPDGAYVSAVAAGSAEDHAGLKPGMVMTQFNGLALKGIPLATLQQIVAAAGPNASVMIVGGTTYALGSAVLTPAAGSKRP